MHELLLFGQVPESRHNQVLNVLAGVAAMQPQPILEKHLIFKPNRTPGSGAQKQVGGAQDIQKAGAQTFQAQDLFYMQLVADVSLKGAEGVFRQGEDVAMDGVEGEGLGLGENGHLNVETPATPASPQAAWTMQFRDLPEVARQRPVTSRLIADTPVVSGDLLKFMTALDYSYTTSYLLSGHRFTHLSTSLLLHRILIPPSPTVPNMETTNIDLSRTRPLDPSGTYILQAAVRVQDGSKMETITKATNELLALKEMLRGCVDLEMGDRLALDTRVR